MAFACQEVEKNVITEMAVKGKLSEKELEELVKQCTPTGIQHCIVIRRYCTCALSGYRTVQ